MGHEVIFDDHAVRKQDILDYKNIGFTYLPYWIEKGGNPWFTSRLENPKITVKQTVSSKSLNHCVIPLAPAQTVESVSSQPVIFFL